MEEDIKLEKRKNIEIVALSIIIVALLGALIYLLFIKEDKPTEPPKPQDNQQTENDSNNEKEKLTSLEMKELNEFFNIEENSLMAHLNFDNPLKLFDKNNKDNNLNWLVMIMVSSKYAQKVSSKTLDTTSFKLSDIKTVLQSLTNNDYSDVEIKDYFSELYDEKTDTYIYEGGGGFLTFNVVNGYKVNNNYYLTISNDEISGEIKVVLQKYNNKYYYYSSYGNEN